MSANVRPVRAAAAVLAVLFLAPVLSGPAVLLRGAQVVPAPDLDRALRANDLQKARMLVPADWTAAEQLFLSYLERAFIAPEPRPRRPDARVLAGRLAEVLFRVTELDFHRAAVSVLEPADPARRQEILAAVRDHLALIDRLRRTYKPQGRMAAAVPVPPAERTRFIADFAAIADRYRALSFPRGEWHASYNATGRPLFGTPLSARAIQLADTLGDELYLVRKEPFTATSLAMAERLGLPKQRVQVLTALANQPPPGTGRGSPDSLAWRIRHFEQARAIAGTVPHLETMNGWTTWREVPVITGILEALWTDACKQGRTEQAELLLAEALEISRQFGENAVLSTVSLFAFSLDAVGERPDEAVPPSILAGQLSVVAASQRFGPVVELEARRAASGNSWGMRLDSAEKALALAVTIPDPYQRAHTLMWYAAGRRDRVNPQYPWAADGPLEPVVFPPAYHQLKELCLSSTEFDLTAEALSSEAAAHAMAGDPAVATGLYRQAIAVAERGSLWLKVARIANRAADWLTGRQSDAAAIDFAGKAAEAARKADNTLELVIALNVTSRTIEEKQEFVRAAARHSEQSGDWYWEVQSLCSLAWTYRRQGEYQAAINTYLRVAERSRKGPRSRSGNSFEVTAYEMIAGIHAENGEREPALAAAATARGLLESTVLQGKDVYGPDDRWDGYERIGSLAALLGQPGVAITYWDRALQEMAAVPLEKSIQVFKRIILEDRAELYAQLGDFDAARRDWNDIKPLIAATARNRSASDAEQRADWLAFVAWTHALEGDLDRAVPAAREALAELARDTSGIWERRIFNGQSADGAAIAVLLAANHVDEAMAFDRAEYERARRETPGNRIRERDVLGRLAASSVRAGQFETARSLLAAATEIDRAHPNALFGGSGDALLALGTLEIEACNYTEAARQLQAARAAVNPYDSNRIWRIERAIGMALARAGDAGAAEAHYENALAALESVPERLRPEESRLRYGVSGPEVYEEYAGLIAARAAKSGQPADADAAFQAAERRRTRAIADLIATGWSQLPSGALPDQVRRSTDAERLLTAKQQILRQQFDLPSGERNRALIGQLQKEVDQLKMDHAHLLASMAQGRYRFGASANLGAPLAAPVRAALGPSRVLVEYLVLDDRSYALVLTQAGVKVVPIAAGRAALRQQVEHLLQPFHELRAGGVDLARLAYDTRAAYALHQTLFAPVRAAAGSLSEILIVPDDVLNVLPFEALIDRTPRSTARGAVLHGQFADEAFLIRRYAIGYLTSAAQLLSGAAGTTAATAPGSLLAMANPTAGRAAPEPARDDPLKRQLRSAGFETMFTPLPGSEVEVNRIAQYFGKDATTIVIGDSATETAYTSQAGKVDVVHFATHAVASDSQPLYSTLLLAPDAVGAGHDGFLQAYEVLRTPLRAELVVLSGCETAIGARDSGQGLVGLVAAFQQAGARSVLATLWSIDEASTEMMDAFYGARARGLSAPAALRQAKLQVLQRRMRLGKVEVSLAHPFFWAPFKLVGTTAGR